MVQVVQRTPGAAQFFGQGLQNALIPAFQQQYQRGLVQNSLKDLKGLSNDPNATPFDLASALISSTAGIPGSEKYVGQLFPLLMNQMQLKQQSGVQPPGSGMQAPQGTSNIGEQRQKLPDWIGEPKNDLFEGALEPTALGLGKAPKIYSPEEIQTAQKLAAQRGLDPAPITKMMDDYNTRARDELTDYVQAAKTQADIASLRSDAQQRFRATLKKELESGGRPLSEDDLTVAEKIAEEPDILKLSNEKARAAAAKKKFNEYEYAKDNFTKSADRRNFDDLELQRQKKNMRPMAKNMEKFGQRDHAIRILKEAGWGPGEVDDIINPLDESVKSGFKDLPKMPEVLARVKTLPDQPGFEEEFTKAQGMRNKEIKSYEKYLADVIKPGTENAKQGNVFTPGTSLLLLQKEFTDKGGTWQEFGDILRRLQESGKIMLDPTQVSQLGLLNREPIKNLGFWEAVMRPLPFYTPRY